MKRLVEYFKDRSEADKVHLLHPITVRLLCEFIEYCEDNKLPCTITDTISTIAEDLALSRVSDTHRTGRAFDASLKNWTDAQRNTCVDYFNKKYPALGAISKENGLPRLAYAHDAGTGMHLHFQIKKELGLPPMEILN